MSIPKGYLPEGNQDAYFADMDKFEKRRLRLIGLIKTQCGGINAEFARRIEKDPSYINRLCYPEGKKGKKRIGDEIIEVATTKFKLPYGWFDFDTNTKIYETSSQEKQKMMDMIMALPEDSTPYARAQLESFLKFTKEKSDNSEPQTNENKHLKFNSKRELNIKEINKDLHDPNTSDEDVELTKSVNKATKINKTKAQDEGRGGNK